MSQPSKMIAMPAFRPVKVTPQFDQALKEARLGFMALCPFLSHFYFAELTEVMTLDVPTAATDGRRIAINPAYFAKLRPAQRIFVLAHETDHAICRHPSRLKHYLQTKGPDGEPMNPKLGNIAADYVINARLIEGQIGAFKEGGWLRRDDVKGTDLWEDVYRKLKDEQKKGKGGGEGDDGSGSQDGQGDGSAHGNGPGGDDLYLPSTDPSTGREDTISDMAFKEAIARAAAYAKGMGKMPAGYQQMVDEILDPQIPWAEHIRLTMTGRIGTATETWTKINRRRVALNPMVILPGRRGYGCDTIVVGLDTSGSIYADPKALEVFFAEMGGIIADCRPKRLVVLHCDATVQQVDEVRDIDEVQIVRSKGVKGGGGTAFEPVFAWCEENQVKPDMVVYLTDGYGSYPSAQPGYPVLWAMTTDYAPPWGDVVRVKVEG